MNILLINHYAGSIYHGMAYRPYYMAREWVKAGHTVTIVAADESHLRGKHVEIQEDQDSYLETIDGINYLWLKTIAYNGNGVKRALNMASFIFQLLRYGKTIKNNFKPDVVISSSTYPAEIFGAHYIAKISNAKLVYEIHDLWPLSPMVLGHMSKWHPFIFGMQIAEDYCYKHCDAVVSMLPKVADHVTEHGLPIEKLHIIPNGIYLNEWFSNTDKIPENLANTIIAKKNNGDFILGYAGGHALSNDLKTVLLASEKLQNLNLSVFLVGKGQEKNNLIELARKRNIKNVIFLDNIKKSAVPDLLSYFDCLTINAVNFWELYKFGVSPNKMFDYMMAGKPVIQAIEAGNDLVKESGCGISVEAENPEALAKAIKQMMNTPAAEREAMGKRGQEFVKANHDYRVLSSKFLQIMENLI